jgi:hypothetical protein
MKYARLQTRESSAPQPLRPVRGTAEAWRTRLDQDHPSASRIVAGISLAVLIGMLLMELPQLINLIGNLAPLVALPRLEIPAVALPGWLNVIILIIAGAAATERGLSMKHNPLLDD